VRRVFHCLGEAAEYFLWMTRKHAHSAHSTLFVGRVNASIELISI